MPPTTTPSLVKTSFMCEDMSFGENKHVMIYKVGSVRTIPKGVENAALFLQLDLPSTLIHHKNAHRTGGI